MTSERDACPVEELSELEFKIECGFRLIFRKEYIMYFRVLSKDVHIVLLLFNMDIDRWPWDIGSGDDTVVTENGAVKVMVSKMI